MSSLRTALPRIEPDPILERNVYQTPVENKTAYKAPIPIPIPSDPSAVPQRQPITPYDATEDLRAKVKLARHDLNEIKQSPLLNEERRQRLENRQNRNDYENKPARQREKFVTNLVPYEKNQSYKVNSVPLDDNPKNYYNYLGEKENPTKQFMPLSNVNQQRILYFQNLNGDVEKTTEKTPIKTKISNESNRKIENTSHRAEHTVHWAEPMGQEEGFTDRRAGQSVNINNRNVDKKNEGGSHPKTGAMPKKVTSPNGNPHKR